jgi:hypothetical protein
MISGKPRLLRLILAKALVTVFKAVTNALFHFATSVRKKDKSLSNGFLSSLIAVWAYTESPRNG